MKKKNMMIIVFGLMQNFHSYTLILEANFNF